MNREILFRGRSVKTGRWIWGSLIQNGQYDYAIYDGNEHSDSDGEEVEEDTIGQYTGINDRKGHRIFEGDIVKFHYFYQSLGENLGAQESEQEIIGKIVWGEFGWSIDAIQGQHWEGYTGYQTGEGECSILELYAMNESSIHEESFDVIGNLHDNPYLLTPAEGAVNYNMKDPNVKAAEANEQAIEAAESAAQDQATGASESAEEGGTEG